MNILAIDTANRRRCIALIAGGDGTPQSEVVQTEAVEGLLSSLPRLLARSVDAVLVCSGPGSYTGVRAGMAAALGIATALRLPIYLCNSLEVVVAGWGEEGEAEVLLDAGRGGFYAGVYARRGPRIEELQAPRRLSQLPPPDGRRRLSDGPRADATAVDPATALARMASLVPHREATQAEAVRPYPAPH